MKHSSTSKALTLKEQIVQNKQGSCLVILEILGGVFVDLSPLLLVGWSVFRFALFSKGKGY